MNHHKIVGGKVRRTGLQRPQILLVLDSWITRSSRSTEVLGSEDRYRSKWMIVNTEPSVKDMTHPSIARAAVACTSVTTRKAQVQSEVGL